MLKLSPLNLTFVLFSFFWLNSSAQIGRSLYVGTTMSSFRNDTISSKGGFRYEVGYAIFAKYSDRLEWTSSIGFLAVKRSDVTVYKIETDPYYGDNVYTPTTAEFNTSQLNYNYSLSYYVIPDQLAIIGGFDIGFDFFSMIKRGNADPDLNRIKLSTDAFTGDPVVLAKPISEIKSPIFNYGPTFGLSYTLADRFVFYAKYSLFLNTYFAKKDDMSETVSTDFTDMSKLNLLRMGVAYKFLPSAKDRRF